MSAVESILEVEALRVEIVRHGVHVVPVDDVSFTVSRGECLGLVGESGSGKSLTLRAVIGLLPAGARSAARRLEYHVGDGLAAYEAERVRGHGISMVFQEPMSALNPTMRVGDLVAEAARAQRGLSRRAGAARAVELLREVGIPDPARRARAWPHELSGGMRQRTMIAMALSSDPQLLLCDEPTTALDVTVQDQILGLLDRVRSERGLSLVFVTHDLAVVRQVADRVAVMYAGRIVETGLVDDVFGAPAHPYTLGLLRSAPTLDDEPRRFRPIEGRPPDPAAFPPGCRFAPRCPLAQDDCRAAAHVLQETSPGHQTACIHADRIGDGGTAP